MSLRPPVRSSRVLGLSIMRLQELSDSDLEELRSQVTEYYEAYYSELRNRMGDHELAIPHAAVPDPLKGYRRIVTELGKDGVMVTHWPDASDSFDFHISPDQTARELVAGQCGGEEVLDYEPGEDFGTYQIPEPLQLAVEGEVVWIASWKRLDVSSHLDAWEDPDGAREAAREALAPFEGGPSVI